MTVTRTDRIIEFGQKHADAVTPLAGWLQVVEAARWRTPADARSTFGSADVAAPVASGRKAAVFNIKGNHYPLVAAIDYPLGVVNILAVMTHKEYSRDRWKETL